MEVLTMAAKKVDPRVTKKRVTMTTYIALPPLEEGGEVRIQKHEAVDYVREDFLAAYVAEASPKWQTVTVSEEYDAGPGGYDGQTHVPARLEHPLAGQTFAATKAADTEKE
jgi:hypothetical protein